MVVEASDLLAFGAVTVLASAHIVPPMLTFIKFYPRSWLLSAAGGVSVAYVFVHLLPEIAEAQATVEGSASTLLAGFERHAYVIALVGLAVFYGLERAAITSKRSRRDADAPSAEEEPTSAGAFWLSMGPFASRGRRRSRDGPPQAGGQPGSAPPAARSSTSTRTPRLPCHLLQLGSTLAMRSFACRVASAVAGRAAIRVGAGAGADGELIVEGHLQSIARPRRHPLAAVAASLLQAAQACGCSTTVVAVSQPPAGVENAVR